MTFTIMKCYEYDRIAICTKNANAKKFAAYFPSAQECLDGSYRVICRNADLFQAMYDIASCVNNDLGDECIFDVE